MHDEIDRLFNTNIAAYLGYFAIFNPLVIIMIHLEKKF